MSGARRALPVLVLLLGLASAQNAMAQGLLGISAGPGVQGPAVRADLSAQVAGLDPDEAYPRRLEAVRQLAARFPGRISSVGHQYREMGLFAGIFMQTLWQHESGRDELPIWYVVNRNLTLVPRAYMSEFEANPGEPYEQSAFVRSHPTRGGASAPITHLDTCRAWKDYFKSADDARRDLASRNVLVRLRGAWNQRGVVTRRLWKAHTTAIRYALWQNQDELVQLPIPEEELAFWRGWIRLVFFSEKIAPATTDLLLKPFLSLAMPPCSPLGESACTAEEQPPLRTAFLDWLMHGKMDQHEFLLVFGGKPNPSGAALASLPAPSGTRATALFAAVAAAAPASSPQLSVLRDSDLAAAVRSGLSADAVRLDSADERLLAAVMTRARARR